MSHSLPKPAPSKRGRTLLVAIGACLALLPLLVLTLVAAAGVRGIYFAHVIATFELRGLHSEAEAHAFLGGFEILRDLRQTTITRSSLSGDRWIARIQFKSSTPEAAWEQIQAWMWSIEPPVTVRLVRAAHYPLRVYRPERGDFVFGAAQPVRALRR